MNDADDHAVSPQDESDSVCHKCIGDAFLKEEAKAIGAKETCLACGKVANGLTIGELADHAHRIFESWFEQVREGDGQSAKYVIAEIMEVDEDIAERIAAQLSDDHGFSAVREGGEDPYDEMNEFAEIGVRPEVQHGRWRAFKDSLLADARFFNGPAKAWLDDIFLDVADHHTWRHEPVVREIDPDSFEGFYRARWVDSDARLHEILREPERRLGPPPNGTARAGRMNAEGISVFYAALDPETAISEIRPPVGSQVVHGCFKPLRALRLLDLDLAEKVVDRTSYFDPDHQTKAERSAAIRMIGKQMAWPVMPTDEAAGYLPTQVIAEYLAEHIMPSLDGILYRSTQTGSKGLNVVLFHRSARVATPEPGTRRLDVDLGWADDEDADDSVTIRIDRDNPDARPKNPPDDNGWDSPVEPLDPRHDSLRLDLESIGVEAIDAVQFMTTKRSVFVMPDHERRHNPEN